MAVKAWNMMGADVDWEALPVVTEILGIEDVELLVVQLGVIRDRQNAQAARR